jgi:hypothetical protein
VDPIGVDGIPEAADEYDGYIGGVYELLVVGAPLSAFSDYVRNIEVDQMGLTDLKGEPLLAEPKRNAVATALKRLRSYLAEA